jgi:hypothetical protein
MNLKLNHRSILGPAAGVLMMILGLVVPRILAAETRTWASPRSPLFLSRVLNDSSRVNELKQKQQGD